MNGWSFIFHWETVGGRKLNVVCINGIEAGLALGQMREYDWDIINS